MKMIISDCKKAVVCMGCEMGFRMRTMLAIMMVDPENGTLEFNDGQHRETLKGMEKRRTEILERMPEEIIEKLGVPEDMEAVKKYRDKTKEMNKWERNPTMSRWSRAMTF